MDTKRTTCKKSLEINILFCRKVQQKIINDGKTANYSRINLILGFILLKSEKQKLIKLYSLNADLAMQTKKLGGIISWFLKERLDKNDYSGSKKLISTVHFLVQLKLR